VIACATILSPVFNLGLQGAAQRFTVEARYHSSERGLLWTTLLMLCLMVGLSVGLLLLLVLFLLPSHWQSDFISTSTLSTVVVHAVAMGIVLVGSEFLRMAHQPRRYAIAISIMSLSYLLMNIVFIGILHWQLYGALLAYAIMPWMGCLAFFFVNREYLHWHLELRLMKELLTYSIKVLPHLTFTTLNSVADRLLLVLLLGQYFAGIYTAGTTLASVMLMFITAIGFSARPQIFAKFSENTPAALTTARQLAITSILIIALAGANITLWSPEIVAILTSQAFHNAWQVTILLTLKYMLQGVSVFLLCSVLFNKVKVYQLSWIALSSLFVLIISSTLLAPLYGIWGIAIAGLLATLFELFLNYQLSKKAFGIKWPVIMMLGVIALYFIPACGLVAITQTLHRPLWETLALKLIFSLGTLISTLLILSRQYKIHLTKLISKALPRKDPMKSTG
jgi:O-antigen/teichoic acid export membrane protein